VGAGPLATITVTPNPSNLNTGGTQTFTAVGKDALGNVMVITPVWSVVNATAGSIDGTGLFTAGAVAGTYINTVQAKSGGISGFATVNVAGVSFVDLGAATSAGILGATAFTCGLNGTINADVMLSPGAAVDPACIITGTKHIDDATAIQAQIDMNTAYNTLMGLPCPGANVESDLAGRTFTAGVLCGEPTARDRRGNSRRWWRPERRLRLPGRLIAHDDRFHQPDRSGAGEERLLGGRRLGHDRRRGLAGKHPRAHDHHPEQRDNAGGPCVGAHWGGNDRHW
jgi:hypothetical protein